MSDENQDPEALALYVCHQALSSNDLSIDGRDRVVETLKKRFGIEARIIEQLTRSNDLIAEAIRDGLIERIPWEPPIKTHNRLHAKAEAALAAEESRRNSEGGVDTQDGAVTGVASGSPTSERPGTAEIPTLPEPAP